ncbi:MAG: c-type cytochrome [Anaerolineales bacterium]
MTAFSACSLAEDITPPPGATPADGLSTSDAIRLSETQSVSPPTAVADPLAVLTTLQPSAEIGAPLFAQHCAACHGPLGNGDGEQAAQLPTPPPKLSSADLARIRSPREWYDVITNGRLEKFMPPFGQTLTDEERWHLVAFVYTLSTPQLQIEQGATIYAASCSECHGADGKQEPDLTSAAFVAARTPSEWSEAVVANAAHTGAVTLSEVERWAVADFVRGFAFDYLAPGATPPERTGTVAGRVTNGTAGAASPDTLELTLFGVEADGLVITRTATTQSAGAFEFTDVPYTAVRQFAVSAMHNGVAYYSELFTFTAGQPRLELPLTIYDTTSDPANLLINRAQTFILFDEPGLATVGQLFSIGNTGDHTFIPTQRNAVQFSLPPDATDFAVPDGEEGVTYIRVGDSFADLRPVPPGEATLEVLVSYRLPESLGLNFSQPMLYSINAATVLVGDATAQLSGAGWERSGTQAVQGTRFTTYARQNIPAGEPLAFSIARGEAVNATGIAAGAVALAAVGATIFIWWRHRGRVEVNARERLLGQLAALDDDFAEGKLAKEWYEQQRTALKGKLKEIWENEGKNNLT